MALLLLTFSNSCYDFFKLQVNFHCQKSYPNFLTKPNLSEKLKMPWFFFFFFTFKGHDSVLWHYSYWLSLIHVMTFLNCRWTFIARRVTRISLRSRIYQRNWKCHFKVRWSGGRDPPKRTCHWTKGSSRIIHESKSFSNFNSYRYHSYIT